MHTFLEATFDFNTLFFYPFSVFFKINAFKFCHFNFVKHIEFVLGAIIPHESGKRNCKC